MNKRLQQCNTEELSCVQLPHFISAFQGSSCRGSSVDKWHFYESEAIESSATPVLIFGVNKFFDVGHVGGGAGGHADMDRGDRVLRHRPHLLRLRARASSPRQGEERNEPNRPP